jgi:hypothetical protein
MNGKKRAPTCIPYLLDCMNDNKNLWFLKPTSCNRGRGVHVFDEIEKMKKLMQGITEGTIEKLV